MDKKLLVGVSILALGLGACAKTEVELPVTSPYIKYKQDKVKAAVSVIPDWYREMPEKKGSIYTVGSSTAPDLQLAVDVATLNAKVTLADRINGKLDSMTKSFTAKIGSNDIDASVLKEIEKALIKNGSSMEKVLKVNVYLADLADYKAMNQVYRGRFGKNPPVRTTVATYGGVPGNSLVEIDCIASLD